MPHNPETAAPPTHARRDCLAEQRQRHPPHRREVNMAAPTPPPPQQKKKTKSEHHCTKQPRHHCPAPTLQGKEPSCANIPGLQGKGGLAPPAIGYRPGAARHKPGRVCGAALRATTLCQRHCLSTSLFWRTRMRGRASVVAISAAAGDRSQDRSHSLVRGDRSAARRDDRHGDTWPCWPGGA